jgi:hypothetical protein
MSNEYEMEARSPISPKLFEGAHEISLDHESIDVAVHYPKMGQIHIHLKSSTCDSFLLKQLQSLTKGRFALLAIPDKPASSETKLLAIFIDQFGTFKNGKWYR